MEEFILTPQLMNYILLVSLWTIPWKGVALWKASRNNQLGWFIALMLVNSLAVLEIVYIFYFVDKKKKENSLQNKIS